MSSAMSSAMSPSTSPFTLKQTSSCAFALLLLTAQTVKAEVRPSPSPSPTPKSVTSPNLDPNRVLEGSNVTVRYRGQADTKNKTTFNQGQYIADFRITLQLDREGKLKLKAVVATDASGAFNADAADLGIGNDSKLNTDPYLKNFYVDYKEGKSHIEVGALPTTPSGVNGAFNLDANGWVDGAFYQYTISGENHWIRDVAVTLGHMNVKDSPQLWKRDFSTAPNLIQIHVRGDLSEIAKYTVEATNYDSEQYLRGIIEIATKDILKFVDQVSIEEMIGSGDQVQQGFALSLKKKLKNEVLVSLVYSRKEDLLANKNPQLMMMEDNFRPGDQLTFRIEKPINKSKTITPFMRVSKTLNKSFTVPATSGARLEVGVKFTLPKSKKSVIPRH